MSALPFFCLFLMAAGAPADAADDRPLATTKEERVEIRMVQVDVSVLDPNAKTYASVPGLTLQHFDLRLDGRRLSDQQRSKVKFDVFCRQEHATTSGPPPQVPVITVVDFNYLDARGRFRVAEAIDQIADKAPEGQEVYKIYGLTRQVRQLTDGFTKDPQALHRAAEIVRGTSFRGGEFVAPGTEDVPEMKRVTLGSLLESFGPSPIQLFTDDQSAAGAEITMNSLFFEAQRTVDPEAGMAASRRSCALTAACREPRPSFSSPPRPSACYASSGSTRRSRACGNWPSWVSGSGRWTSKVSRAARAAPPSCYRYWRKRRGASPSAAPGD
ncbi:MAG: hypothetical protein Q9Q13_06775 [Acidobacteriota bacterium]|nr:hypothetical protein [Acidobacteriota bacterium]